MIEFFRSIGAWMRTTQEFFDANPDVTNGIGIVALLVFGLAVITSFIAMNIWFRKQEGLYWKRRWGVK